MTTFKNKKVTEALTGYLFVAPWLFIFFTFSVFSLVYAISCLSPSTTCLVRRSGGGWKVTRGC